ncbi:hypothetical protein C5S32_08640 [ANME-1 cluster archaeon GoMg1]|nr:hypothetical protein [ANME-1 cluster archaeon GoMg1]
MKQVSNSKCPKCGSEEFTTQPNRYDCLRFVNGQFQVEKSELTDDKDRIFCRECGAEIDVNMAIRHKKIILRKSKLEY